MDDGKTLEEYIASMPNPDYDDKDWEMFVKYRTGTKAVKFSKTNKKNMDSQKIYHTHGSKPFNITQQELEDQLGRTITKGELFLETHKKGKKKKKFPNKPTEAMYNQVEKNLADLNIPTEFSPDDAVGRCYQGKEKSGRVRHMGLAKTPSADSSGSGSSNASKRKRATPGSPINEEEDDDEDEYEDENE
ncbi:hypothetical protein LINGRAHAP2_LOCUS35079 [Linum grandiflorum]